MKKINFCKATTIISPINVILSIVLFFRKLQVQVGHLHGRT